MKKRILHSIDTTGPGGAEIVFLQLIKGLDKSKFVSYAVISGTGWLSNELQKITKQVFFVESKGAFNFRYLLKLIKIIKSNKIDIIQSHLLGSNLYCSIAGFLCGIPVISTFHGFVDVQGNDKLLHLKARIINLGSHNIVFVSKHLFSHFQRFNFSLKKAVVVYNGVDASAFSPKRNENGRTLLGFNKKDILIGSVGNIRVSKGYDYLMRAARIVVNKYPHCVFVVAGEASGDLYADLLSLREKLRLENNFFFLGYRKDTAELLNSLDIFVLPSVSEGFSIATIEAMAVGVPVVVTKSGGPEEIIENNSNGILVRAQDAISLSNGIIEFIENPESRQKMILEGLRAVKTKFSSKHMIANYQKLYNEVITNC